MPTTVVATAVPRSDMLAELQRMGKRYTIEEHPASSLFMDERIQRAIRPRHLRKIRSALDPDAIGVIIVSRRPDGRLAVLDGQHRVRALIDEGRGDYLVTCKIFEGLTIPEEAGLFRRFNMTSKTSALEDLEKAILEGEPEAIAIHKMVVRNGYRLSRSPGATIACAAQLRAAYRAQDNGPASLGFSLHVATQAWGAHSDSVDGSIVRGLAGLYLAFGEEIDRAALINKLAKHKGGAPGFLGQAKALAGLEHLTVHHAVARRAHGLYNKGRRVGLLPPL